MNDFILLTLQINFILQRSSTFLYLYAINYLQQILILRFHFPLPVSFLYFFMLFSCFFDLMKQQKTSEKNVWQAKTTTLISKFL